MTEKADIKSMNTAELAELTASLGQPKFRAAQIFKWLSRGVTSFDEMTDLPKELRTALDGKFRINRLEIARKQRSRDGGAIKYLWRLHDGNCIESVIMVYRHGNTICVSSQAGCRMGCAFCASGEDGLLRNLTPSEMLDQILFAQADSGLKLSNIVLMGMGEPLDNLPNVLKFLEIIGSDEGLNIGMRHISLSTCGLIPRMDELAGLKLQLTLSVSLHFPDDSLRSSMMPVNKTMGLDRLVASCKNYYDKTGRRISFEYAMINGVNDTPEMAVRLGGLLKGLPCHINLIPLNGTKGGLCASDRKQIDIFRKILEDKGFTVTVRRSLGGDIDAACGQLRGKDSVILR